MRVWTIGLASLLLALPVAAQVEEAAEELSVEPSSTDDPLDDSIQLRWLSGDDCIDAPQLSAAVEARLGRPVFVAADAARTIEGEVTTEARGFRVTFTITGADGERQGTRTIRSRETACHDLDAAIVLTLVILVDPAAALAPPEPASQPEPEPEPESESESEPEPEPESEPESASEVDPTPDLALSVDLEAVSVAGLFPDVAFGVRLSGGLHIGEFLSVELAGFAFPSAPGSDPDGRVEFRAFGGGLGLCARWAFDPLAALGVCARVDVAAYFAEGQLPLDSASYVRAELWPGVAARLALTPGPLAVGIEVGAGVPIVRDRFYVELPAMDRRVVHRVSPVIGWLALRISFSP